MFAETARTAEKMERSRWLDLHQSYQISRELQLRDGELRTEIYMGTVLDLAVCADSRGHAAEASLGQATRIPLVSAGDYHAEHISLPAMDYRHLRALRMIPRIGMSSVLFISYGVSAIKTSTAPTSFNRDKMDFRKNNVYVYIPNRL